MGNRIISKNVSIYEEDWYNFQHFKTDTRSPNFREAFHKAVEIARNTLIVRQVSQQKPPQS